MQIYYEHLTEIDHYIQESEKAAGDSLDSHDEAFTRYLRQIAPGVHKFDGSTKILEVGIGTGWFPIMCAMRGLQCKGIDISPELVEYSRKWGQRLGVVPDVEVGNIENCPLDECAYDAIIASSVFEHVENWRLGLRRLYLGLKPGGVLYFESTNKFGFAQGEYKFPLYSWLPDRLRYKLRMMVDDPNIMKLGIDFNQFRFSQLRQEFERIGFSKVLDRIEMSQEDMVSTKMRKVLVRVSRRIPLVRTLTLTFCDGTRFLCFK